jgi:hypothetical protein
MWTHSQHLTRLLESSIVKYTWDAKMVNWAKLVPRAINFVKWLSFVFCSVGFVWKVYDGFDKYLEQEVGTKIELKSNNIDNLPGLAVCRHPNQVKNLMYLA